MITRQSACVNGHPQTPENYFNYGRKGQYTSGCKACRRVRDRARYARNSERMRSKRLERYLVEKQQRQVRKAGKGHEIALQARKRLLADVIDPAVAELIRSVPIGEYHGRDSD